MVRILYFSWIRERLGADQEEIETTANSVHELIEELKLKEERYAHAFSDLSSVRVAVDQKIADFHSPITNATEIALFPPMTGG